MGPLLFALVLHCFVQIIQKLCGFSVWYLDDGNLIVNRQQLLEIIEVLQGPEAIEKGLFLNLGKCFIYSNQLPAWVSEIQYLDPETGKKKNVPSGSFGTVVLGTPIGSQEYIDKFIKEEVLLPLDTTLENIKLLNDSHTEFFLFRSCATFCKISYILRTLPPEQGNFLRKEYESRMKTFLQHLTKAEIPDLAWIQSELQFRLGGLGLKYSISHHQAAFLASLIQCNFWIEKVCSSKARNKAQSLIEEYKNLLRNAFPTDFPDDAAIKSATLEQSSLQHTFSSCIDSHTLNSLLNNPALPTREKARLRAVSAVGAARWLSAAPNFKNFKYFESNQFSVALRYWLGIPIFNSTCKCRCGQIIDVFGDHATTCKVGGGPIHRHDLIRDAIFECCNMAGISASKEITGYQAGQKDRVGDVVLNSFDHGREMLVDVTCWSPLYLPRIQHSAASSKYTVSEAHSFKLKSRNTNQEGRIKTTKGMVAFMPFACDTFGGSCPEATKLLHSIALEMSLKHNNSKAFCLSRISTRVSVAIQQGNSFCLINKLIDLKLYYDSNLPV